MSLVHQPYDKFAKASLKQIAIVKAFFKAHLPKAIYQRLDVSSLQPVDTSYLSPEFQSLRGDIVYRCQIDGQAGYIPILLLIEHQSSADQYMAFRLWRYTLNVMQDHLNAGYDKLPIVLPLCLYHGTESPYPYSTDIYDSFDEPALAKQLVFQPFQLIDLTQISIEELKTHGVAALMEVLLRSARDRKIIQRLRALARSGTLIQTIRETGPHFLESVLYYVIECDPEEGSTSVDQLTDILNEALPDQRQLIMTFREQLEAIGIEKGRYIGLEEGRQEGRYAGMKEAQHIYALKMRQKGLDPTLIKEILQLSEEIPVEVG